MFLYNKKSPIFKRRNPRYHVHMNEQNDEHLGPFSKEHLSRMTLGPFVKGAPLIDPSRVEMDPPLRRGAGIGRDELKALLDANPDSRELLSLDESQVLRDYLSSGQETDVRTLNALLAELAGGLRARKVVAERRKEATTTRPRQVSGSAPFLQNTPSGQPPERGGSVSDIRKPEHWWLK